MNLLLITVLVISGVVDLAVAVWAVFFGRGFSSIWLGTTEIAGPLHTMVLAAGLFAAGFAALQAVAIQWLRKENEDGFRIAIGAGIGLALFGVVTSIFARTQLLPNALILLAVDGLRGVALFAVAIAAQNAPAVITELRLPSSATAHARRGRELRESEAYRGHSRSRDRDRDRERGRGSGRDRDRRSRSRSEGPPRPRRETGEGRREPLQARPLRDAPAQEAAGPRDRQQRVVRPVAAEDSRDLSVVVTGKPPVTPPGKAPAEPTRVTRGPEPPPTVERPMVPRAPMVPRMRPEVPPMRPLRDDSESADREAGEGYEDRDRRRGGRGRRRRGGRGRSGGDERMRGDRIHDERPTHEDRYRDDRPAREGRDRDEPPYRGAERPREERVREESHELQSREDRYREDRHREDRYREEPIREERFRGVREERMRPDETPTTIPEEIGPIGPVDFHRDRGEPQQADQEPIDRLSPFESRSSSKPDEPTYVVTEFGRSSKPAAIGSRKGKHTRPRETKVHRPLGSMHEAEGGTPPESTPRIATEGRIGMTGGIGPIDLEEPEHQEEGE